VGDFWDPVSDAMIVGLLAIKTRIIWPNGRCIEECDDVLRITSEMKSDVRPYQTAA
jgi:hypothetical protein